PALPSSSTRHGGRMPASRRSTSGKDKGTCDRDIFCDMKTIAISMDEDDLTRIDKVTASTDGVKNRSQCIRQAVRDYLARIGKAAEEEREREIFRRNRHRLHQQA